MPTVRRRRRRTATLNFGTGARESHDASAFYGRFRAPTLSTDDEVATPRAIPDPFVQGDARSMDAVDDRSVALVVTSPPYFAGKQYEEELAREGVPSSYLEYLQLLTQVFAECARKLEPGGRIAVNVANLGRKPYRSLSADVSRILEHDLGLLPRGELIWRKAEGATGSCAWGSFRRAGNPVLRDLTERVIVASKGRFDRARTPAQRAAAGLPHESTLATDDFLALTLDVWSIPPERARRVGHPAPFPVELPARLIQLYTYRDDLVLDPFMGSGSALVAAARLDRRYVGYDLDPQYVELARRRVATEAAEPLGVGIHAQSMGRLAMAALVDAGFIDITTDQRVKGVGVVVPFAALDGMGRDWRFDVAGAATSWRSGLSSSDTAWRALGRAAALGGTSAAPLVVLTTDLPDPGSAPDQALRAAGPAMIFDVIDLTSASARSRLAHYNAGAKTPVPGFWSARDLGAELPIFENERAQQAV
ncbi:MAG: DNA-methyltransferase [Ilumatobacteraceae bacterium]